MRLFVLFAIFFVPTAASAAVFINEVAWMGSAESANDEWIELYNSGGAPVDLAGWTLSDGQSLSILLEGMLEPGAYGVLERTDDSSAPGTAFLIYTGALGNDGRTLKLHRSDGSLEDQVAGGENWTNVGGNNETKETAQFTTSGWITAPPTPGGENAKVGTPQEVDDEPAPSYTTSRPSSPKRSGKNEKESVDEDPELTLSIDAPTIAYANQDVRFVSIAEGIGPTITNSLKYTWNFGDTYSSSKKDPTHRYRYPGEYVVVVRAAYGEHDEVGRHTIVVLPVTVSIERSSEGNILLHNNAKYEIDISGYTLAGNREIVFPENSILLPGGTITVQRSRVEKGAQKEIAFLDTRENLVTTNLRTLAAKDPIDEPIEYAAPVTLSRHTDIENEPVLEESEKPNTVAVDTADSKSVLKESQKASVIESVAEGREAGQNFPYYLLMGLLVVAILGVYAGRIGKNEQN